MLHFRELPAGKPLFNPRFRSGRSGRIHEIMISVVQTYSFKTIPFKIIRIQQSYHFRIDQRLPGKIVKTGVMPCVEKEPDNIGIGRNLQRRLIHHIKMVVDLAGGAVRYDPEILAAPFHHRIAYPLVKNTGNGNRNDQKDNIGYQNHFCLKTEFTEHISNPFLILLPRRLSFLPQYISADTNTIRQSAE